MPRFQLPNGESFTVLPALVQHVAIPFNDGWSIADVLEAVAALAVRNVDKYGDEEREEFAAEDLGMAAAIVKLADRIRNEPESFAS
jgi:hypothetical protein